MANYLLSLSECDLRTTGVRGKHRRRRRRREGGRGRGVSSAKSECHVIEQTRQRRTCGSHQWGLL